jgi:nicotinamide-nucleotide amidase
MPRLLSESLKRAGLRGVWVAGSPPGRYPVELPLGYARTMVSDPELYELAVRVGHKLRAAGRHIVTAESCTGGWVSKTLTDVPGSSQWFECGFVTYSNAAKVRDLGVSGGTLDSFGAVSEQAVREMAEGALRVTHANVALAVSGIAGPDGAAPGKPVGTVWFCAAAREGRAIDIIAEEQFFEGDRAQVRGRSVEHGLRLILRLDLPVRPESSPRAQTK